MAKFKNPVLKEATIQAMCFWIKLYQWVCRPIMRPCCRFYPRCSDYALAALKLFGPLKGSKMLLWRILRCHPWSLGGYDPVKPDCPLNTETKSKEKI